MRLPVLSVLVTVSLVGCAPHDGEVTGDWLAYFSSGTSLNLLDIQEVRKIDLAAQENLDRLGLVPVDCRPLAADEEGQRLPLADTSACVEDAQWFWWLAYDYSFYKKEGKIEPYRVEAIITSEHDLQLTIHMNVPRFGDVRVGWVIDPRFQPAECQTNEDGTAELVDVDGDWLANWSAAEDGGTLFNLNSLSYQINPSNGDDYWSIEQDWQGGYSFGRFVEDDFQGHPTDYLDQYGLPLYVYTYTAQGGQLGNLPDSRSNYDGWVDDMVEEFTFSESNPSDLAGMGQSTFPLEIKVEDNAWRLSPEEEEAEQSTSAAYGLENWIGINTSWVKIDLTPEEVGALETGNQSKPVTGTFQVSLDGLASASKLFVNGSFSLDHITADVWGYQNTLDEIKREENNTPECGEDRTTLED